MRGEQGGSVVALEVAREDGSFVGVDGVTIHYYRWRAASAKGIVLVVHGVGEHATRYEELAQALMAAGYTVYAGDLRGHGQTGLHQYAGDLTKLGRPGPGGIRSTIGGIRQLTSIAHAEHPHLPLVLLGHSFGSLLAQKILTQAVADYDAVVLSGTAYRTVLHMNSGDLNKRFRHLGTTGAEWLSRDPGVSETFTQDPLTFDAKVLKLYGLADSVRLLGRPRQLARDIPLLIQIGSEDPVGGPRSVELLARAYRRRGGLSDVTVLVYPDARHEVYNEINRAEVVADLVAWLDGHLGSATADLRR
jgi:alpha-beta hydrolase superfamily lysophospholipase